MAKTFFRNILAAVDGSEPAVKAARAAISIAGATGARLTVVAVIHIPPQVYSAGPFVPGPGVDYTEELREHLAAQARKALDRVAELGRKEDVEMETRVLEGHVPTTILKFAGRGGYDLLVVGSRGLGGVGRLFLGSVSNALVHGGNLSVLVVK